MLTFSDSGGSRERRLQLDGPRHHAGHFHSGQSWTTATHTRNDGAAEAREGLRTRYTDADAHHVLGRQQRYQSEILPMSDVETGISFIINKVLLIKESTRLSVFESICNIIRGHRQSGTIWS